MGRGLRAEGESAGHPLHPESLIEELNRAPLAGLPMSDAVLQGHLAEDTPDTAVEDAATIETLLGL